MPFNQGMGLAIHCPPQIRLLWTIPVISVTLFSFTPFSPNSLFMSFLSAIGSTKLEQDMLLAELPSHPLNPLLRINVIDFLSRSKISAMEKGNWVQFKER